MTWIYDSRISIFSFPFYLDSGCLIVCFHLCCVVTSKPIIVLSEICSSSMLYGFNVWFWGKGVVMKILPVGWLRKVKQKVDIWFITLLPVGDRDWFLQMKLDFIFSHCQNVLLMRLLLQTFSFSWFNNLNFSFSWIRSSLEFHV